MERAVVMHDADRISADHPGPAAEWSCTSGLMSLVSAHTQMLLLRDLLGLEGEERVGILPARRVIDLQ